MLDQELFGTEEVRWEAESRRPFRWLDTIAGGSCVKDRLLPRQRKNNRNRPKRWVVAGV